MQTILILLPLKEQKQGDAPTEGNNVRTECVMDYSDQFTTYSIFNGRNALLRWARAQGKMNNIVIVIKRSDYEVQSSEIRPREIAIGFVDNDHYVQVHLFPDHPIPPVSKMWHEQSDICNVTHLYSRYQARVDAFQQLPRVENVANTDTVILMTDENAPITELRL
ncbi:unnamed protein product [Prunus armeniaca]